MGVEKTKSFFCQGVCGLEGEGCGLRYGSALMFARAFCLFARAFVCSGVCFLLVGGEREGSMAQEDMDSYTQTLGLGLHSLVSFSRGHTAQFLPGG